MANNEICCRKNDAFDVKSKANVGQAISSYITSKWNCRRFLFTHSLSFVEDGKSMEMRSMNNVSIDVLQILDSAMDDLSIGSGISDVAVYKAIDVIISEVLFFLCVHIFTGSTHMQSFLEQLNG